MFKNVYVEVKFIGTKNAGGKTHAANLFENCSTDGGWGINTPVLLLLVVLFQFDNLLGQVQENCVPDMYRSAWLELGMHWIYER